MANKKTGSLNVKSSNSNVKSLNKDNFISKDVLNEIILIITITSGFLFSFCIYSEDVGILGNFISRAFKGFLGIGAYILPIIITVYSIYILLGKSNKIDTYRGIILTFIIWIFISIIHINNKSLVAPYDCNFFEFIVYYFLNGSWNNGGLLGAALGGSLIGLIGIYGTYIFLYSAVLILIMLLTKKPIFKLINKYFKDIKTKESLVKKDCNIKIHNYSDDIVEAIIPTTVLEPLEKALEEAKEKKRILESTEEFLLDKTKETEICTTSDSYKESVHKIAVDGKNFYTYTFPPTEFLNKKPVKAIDKVKLEIEMKENAIKLERTLKSFGVVASVLDICKGPTVTRYELQPKEGVKVSKIVNLSDDIALNLAAAGLRIEAPIPGKAAIGIEVPNKDIQTVYLREIIESKEFVEFQCPLAFGVGKNISGDSMVADISKMPHMLIAGATGSGKSVCINTIITSILYKATPKEVKLIMIDPKVVELSVYNGIPHLLIPVVTDPKKAASALNWAVQEMINRYKLFAKYNVRDIKGYNDIQKETEVKDLMPNMVIIIDELADLMMVSPKDVEDAICRLAQMARAAGIHLIIATQRPSVDVITGVIKANIPSRIAFAVSSGIDSRTILDMIGAEKLLGKGDMLFYPSGIPKPIRIQGAFISDKEVEKVVEFIKSTGETDYNKDIIEKISSDKITSDGDNTEEYIKQALKLIVGKEKISVAMLQKQLKIGFNLASKIMVELEIQGAVGEDEGNKQHKVLFTKQDLKL